MRCITCLHIVAIAACCSASALGASAAAFETGVVAGVTTGAAADVWNCLPNVARLGNGDLLAVWSTSSKAWGMDLQLKSSVSYDGGRTWSKRTPLTVAADPKSLNCDCSLIVDDDRVLLIWSRVRNPTRFDKIETWKTSSTDFGRTWTPPVEIKLPHKYSGSLGRSSLKLRDGTLVLPYGWDIWVEQGMIPRTEGEMNCKASLMTSRDHGAMWQAGGDVYVDAPRTSPFATGGACEPGIVELADGSLFMLVRTATTRAWQSRSHDQGKTWDRPEASPLTAHNTNVTLRRLPNSSEVLAVWNNSTRNRWPLVAAVSADGCQSWSKPRELAGTEGLESSYASITEADHGTIVVLWQQDLPTNMSREIRFARFNRAWLR